MRWREINEARDYDDLHGAKRWLAQYTYEGLDRWPSEEVVAELLARYPSDDETIYRGMNFRTEQEWDQFCQNTLDLETGTFTSNGITSWTHTRSQARQFAIVRPTYFPDRETFQQEKLAREAGEELRGYMGVILKTHIKAGEAIDVNKSGLGHESEVILPRGTYHVEVERIRRFHDMIEDGELDIEQFIATLPSDNKMDQEQSSLLHHILHTKSDRLSTTAQNHLFARTKKLATKLEHHIDENRHFGRKEDDYDANLNMWYYTTFYDYAEKGYFGRQNEEAVKRCAQQLMRQFFALVKQYPNHYISCRGIGRVAALAGQTGRLKQFLKQSIGAKYNELNSREVARTIKSDNDIYKHKKRLMAVMNQYSELVG